MSSAPRTDNDDARPLMLTIGHEALVIRRRYEVLSILNDLCIGIWFLIGSIMFLSSAWEAAGTWLFILGSAQLLIRPLIRLANHIHLRRITGSSFNL